MHLSFAHAVRNSLIIKMKFCTSCTVVLLFNFCPTLCNLSLQCASSVQTTCGHLPVLTSPLDLPQCCVAFGYMSCRIEAHTKHCSRDQDYLSQLGLLHNMLRNLQDADNERNECREYAPLSAAKCSRADVASTSRPSVVLVALTLCYLITIFALN